MIPLGDNVMLVYGVDFQQSTDQSLARVFLQELKEAKNHVKNCIAGNVYCEMDETPKNIVQIDHPKKYSNGLVVFNLFVNKFDKENYHEEKDFSNIALYCNDSINAGRM